MAWTIPDLAPRLRRWRLAPLLAALALLAACSSTTFFYNRLDFLLPWYVGDYVELSAPQERELDRLLAPFLDWHRYQELPRYAALLQQAESMLDGGLSQAEVRALTREVELAGDRMQARALDWLLPMGEEISQAQVAEFIDNLREKQGELEEKYLERDAQEYREDTYDRLLDQCQDYLGRLSGDQREVLRRGVEAMQRSDTLWLEERAQWVDRLEDLLQRDPGWQDRLRSAVAGRWTASSADYRSMYQHNLTVIQTTVTEVLNSRSERQDRHLRRRLNALREDFVALSLEGRQGSVGRGGGATP
jgi:Family of unknown function (DUF6279)